MQQVCIQPAAVRRIRNNNNLLLLLLLNKMTIMVGLKPTDYIWKVVQTLTPGPSLWVGEGQV